MAQAPEDVSQQDCSTCRARTSCSIGRLGPDLLKQFRTIAQVRFYERGATIFRQGNSSTGLFTICSGWIKLTHVTATGRATTVGLCRPGSVLGLPEILTLSSHRISAEAVEKSKLEYVPKNDFLLFLEDNPTTAVELLKITCHELERVLAELCEMSGRIPAAARLLHILQDLSKTCGRPTTTGIKIALPFTEQDLADRIGCSRQWICGLLRDLETQGMICRKRGWIELTA